MNSNFPPLEKFADKFDFINSLLVKFKLDFSETKYLRVLSSIKSLFLDRFSWVGFTFKLLINAEFDEKSKLEFNQAGLKLKNAEQQVLLKSAAAYYDLLYKLNNRQFNLANVDLFERQVESDRSRLQKGEITLTDLAQSESSLAGANAKLITADTELQTAKSNFERVIRLSAPNEIIKDNFIKNINLNFPQNLSSALKASEQNNPKLLLSKLDYEISEKNVNIEKAKFAPSASVNYTQSKSNDYSSTVDEQDQETLKATVTLPLFKGGENYSTLKKVKYKKEQSQLIFQDTQNEVKTDTANAWSVYQSSESVLKATQAQLKAAEIANEGIAAEYERGSRTTLDVIQSNALLLSAQISLASSEKNYLMAQYNLLKAVGLLNSQYLKLK